MSAKFKKYVGYFIVAVVLIGLGKQCHREAPVSGTKEYFPPEVSSSRSAPLRQGEASPCSRQSPARSSYRRRRRHQSRRCRTDRVRPDAGRPGFV